MVDLQHYILYIKQEIKKKKNWCLELLWIQKCQMTEIDLKYLDKEEKAKVLLLSNMLLKIFLDKKSALDFSPCL